MEVAALPVHPTLLAVAGREVALSHLTAARAWGLPVDDGGEVHVTIPTGTRRRALAVGTRVHRTRRWDAELLDGVPVTSLVRTLADVAACEPPGRSVPVLDAGLRHTTRAAILTATPARGPAVARTRLALELADERAESPLESRARVDLWYEGLVIEADGFVFHSAREDYRRDRRRQRSLTRLGLGYLRFAWEDVHHRPDQVVEDVRLTLAARAACSAAKRCDVDH